MKIINKPSFKNGISLIVLVITIIVMIILATAIIISLTKNSLINKANKAVEDTNLKNIEEAAAIAYWQVASDENINVSEIPVKVREQMIKNGIPKEELKKYDIAYSEKDGIQVSKVGDTSTTTDPSDLVFEITTTTNNQQLVMPFIPDEALNEIYLLHNYSGAYNNNFTLDYGDGTDVDTIDTLSDFIQHTYATQGKYTVKVTGTCRSLILDTLEIGTNTPITKIVQWGDTKLLFVALVNPNMSSIPSVTNDNELSDLIYFQLSNSANITAIPSGLFNNSLSLMRASFKSTSITSVPSGLFSNCSNLKIIFDLFRGCTSLTTIPSGLFDQCTKLEDIECIFQDCTSLTSVPEDLFASCTSLYDIESIFDGCTSLTTVPSDLFDGCTQLRYVDSAFKGCSNLTGAVPDFWNNTKFGHITGYTDCYAGLDSNKITNYASIPAEYK